MARNVHTTPLMMSVFLVVTCKQIQMFLLDAGVLPTGPHGVAVQSNCTELRYLHWEFFVLWDIFDTTFQNLALRVRWVIIPTAFVSYFKISG
jgi:hypothetical protein